MPAVSPARPLLAFIFGSLVSGLGLLYVGRPRLAVALVATLWSCLLLGGKFGLFATPHGLLVLLGFILITKCVSAFAGAWLARRRTKLTSKRDYLFYLAGMAATLWLLTQPGPRSFLLGIEGYRVEGNGMAPTVITGDAIICASGQSHYSLGDVVAYEHGGRIKVARIAATEGDNIEIAGGNVVLNGRDLGLFHAWSLKEKSDSLTFQPTQIAAGYLFMLGDDRDKSRDSRYDGPVLLAKVRCKVTGIFYSKVSRRTGLAVW